MREKVLGDGQRKGKGNESRLRMYRKKVKKMRCDVMQRRGSGGEETERKLDGRKNGGAREIKRQRLR